MNIAAILGDGPRRPVAYEGMIAADALDLDDAVTVTLSDFDDGRQVFGPCPWMPRGELLPSRGDRALVVFSDDGDPWIVAWTPYD